jgi:hypothetical protein
VKGMNEKEKKNVSLNSVRLSASNIDSSRLPYSLSFFVKSCCLTTKRKRKENENLVRFEGYLLSIYF